MARVVRGPDGRRWKVRRRWPLWRLRWRGLDGPSDVGNVGDVDGILGVIVLIFVIILVLPALIALVIFALEFLLLLILLPIVFVWRVATGKAWNVEAKPLDAERPRPRWRVRVPGWGASGEMVDQLAAEIATTGAPRSAVMVPPRRLGQPVT